MLEPRYVLYSFYEDGGFRKFIYWDTKEKAFAISEKRKAGIVKSGMILFLIALMDFFGIKISSGPHIKNNWWLAIIVPLVSLLIFKILYFIQNNKEKDFYDLNINDTDTLMKIIYKTRNNMVKHFISGELWTLLGVFLFIVVVPLNQLVNVCLFYIIESLAIVDPFITYLPGCKIFRELKQQYPLAYSSSKKDNKNGINVK